MYFTNLDLFLPTGAGACFFKMGPCAALVTCATIKDWENLISVQKTWLKDPIILHHHSHLDFLMV